MKYTTIFEKIECLFKLISKSNIYPIFLVVLLFLIGLFFTKKIKNKKIIVLMIISYLILFIITISNNYKALSKVFDSISTNLFTNIYFPSTYTYLFVLLIVDIVTITSLLNIKVEKIYKIANGLCFFTIKFILVLIMEVVAKNNIDIFSKKSLFGNTHLVILLETSIGIFIIWLVSLAVIYISNKITEIIIIKNTNKELETASVTLPNTLEIEVTSNEELSRDYNKEATTPTKEVAISSIIQENSNIPTYINYNNYNQNNIEIINNVEPTNLKNIQINNEIKKEEKIDSSILFDRLLNNGLPLIKEEKIIETPTITKDQPKEQISTITKEEQKEETIKDSYTLNDYRIFNKILNDIKEFNNSNTITINAYLELKLKAKYTAEKYYLFKEMLNNSSI